MLYRGARILILDEPTAVLVPQEVDELFDSLRELTAGGATVIFISHKLDEVLKVADAITVIRAGRTVAELPDTAGVTARHLAELMVGSELPSPETRERTVQDRVLLKVEHLSLLGPRPAPARRREHHGPCWRDRRHRRRRGQRADRADRGAHRSPRARAVSSNSAGRTPPGCPPANGATAVSGYIPEDRQHDGLVLPASLWENVMLGHQSQVPFAKGPWIDRTGAHERTKRVIAEFDVRTPGPDVPAFTLSGGNQQKLIVGREMVAEPKVLLAAHPTRGVDVGAQATIWDIIRDARSKGLGVLLISADLDELIGLSDRLLVMLRGRVVAELDPAHVTPADLGSYTAETVATLDSYQGLHIDNFEGLARHHGNRFFMVSDDNDVFVQRTLLVYFELLDR